MTDNFYLIAEAKDKRMQMRKQEKVMIQLHLTSTRITQNGSLHALLHWRDNQGGLTTTLDRFLYIQKTEIIKFLEDIFASLFGILEELPKLGPAVYTSLVFILGAVSEDRSQHAKVGGLGEVVGPRGGSLFVCVCVSLCFFFVVVVVFCFFLPCCVCFCVSLCLVRFLFLDWRDNLWCASPGCRWHGTARKLCDGDSGGACNDSQARIHS